jgi:hypothetical protein
MPLGADLDVDTRRDGVRFAFRISNGGADPVELTFPDARRADFAVFEDGDEVWRWSDGRMFAQVIETATLDPGESTTYAGTWEEPRSGTYVVRATLRAQDADVRADETFSVGPATR